MTIWNTNSLSLSYGGQKIHHCWYFQIANWIII